MTAAETERARAKINLALHVVGKRADGYHLLDSLVVFADFGDVLRANPSKELTLNVSGHFSQGVPTDERNIVLKAAKTLQQVRGVTDGAELLLDKSLPHGAGIGGGSSDAAAAISLLSRLWNVPPLGPEEALELGADVPVCLLQPAPTFVRGIGEVLEPAPRLPEAWLVLVNPGIVVATEDVFKLYDQQYSVGLATPDPMVDFASFEAFECWLLEQHNDLTRITSKKEIAPVVTDVLAALLAFPSCRHADMSGSGSTCWGLFRTADEAKIAVDQLHAIHPGWWVQATKI